MPTADPEGNGLAALEQYTARTNTWAVGDQVASADLNAIQDGMIGLSEGLDQTRAEVATSRMCDTTTSALVHGGGTTWVYAESNDNNEVVLDNRIDWRDRYIIVEGWVDVPGSIDFPGETSDDDEEGPATDTSHPGAFMHTIFYSEQGTGASPPAAGARADVSGTEKLVVYVNTSGALCMRMSPWSSSNARFYGAFRFSPNLAGY